MILFKTKPVPVQEEETSVWICKNENCLAWIRRGLTFEEIPQCPLCQSEMTLTTKMLPVLKRILKHDKMN